MLEYDGSNFAGWQQQAKGRTVEAELKKALRSITGQDLKVYGAGRTDAGAHAEGQVANFHTDARLTPRRLMAALNARLPEDVAVLSAEAVADDFHARYSARRRRYRYRYLDRTGRPALERVTRRGDFVELELVAEGFLRGMVRSIAGALAEVGRGKRPPAWVGEVLRARDRHRAPRTAPAGGLTLMEVIY